MQTLEDQLRSLLAGTVCIVGVGNRMRGDDAAGSLLAERIAGRIAAAVIDAGSAPENYLEKIARGKPGTVLVIDAVDFSGSPGEVRLLEAGAIGSGGLSTHAPSLRLAADYLTQRCGAQVWVAAIQPASVAMGAGMDASVSAAVDRLAASLLEVLPAQGP
jgi:hydrogenase 3 maturation protease